MKISDMYRWESSDSGIDYGLAKYKLPKTALNKEDMFFSKIDSLVIDKEIQVKLSNLFYDLYYGAVVEREEYAYSRGFKTAVQLLTQCVNNK